ncbi:MAG: hypothetical protein ACE5EN_04325 [Nitrospinota bacterium]
MGHLRDKIFYHTVNDAIDRVREEHCAKYKPKKENRFFINGITYEISEGKMQKDSFQFEISSKIPQEIFDKKGVNTKYFNEVKKLMNSKPKRPADVKMENIIHSTSVSEIKERDYVKCTYIYKESELYSEKDVDAIVKQVLAKEMKLPEISGVTTIPGQAVLYLIGENVHSGAQTNIDDLIKSNDEGMKKFGKKSGASA